MNARWRLPLGALLAASLALVPARAQPLVEVPLELEWVAPAECPTREQVRREVARMAGVGGALRRVVARAKITRAGSGAWHVTIETLVEGTKGHRAFDAETCAAAADGAALMLAIAVNPLASVAAPPPVASSTTEAPAPAPPPDVVVADASPAPPPPRSPRATPLVSFGAALASDLGSLPTAALGVRLVLGITPGAFRLELLGDVWAPQNAAAPVYAGDGARFRLETLGARIGYAFSSGAIHGGPFVGATVARLSADGFGGTATYQQRATWLAPLAGAFVEWSFARFGSVQLTGEMNAPLSRPSFVLVDNASRAEFVIHQVGRVVGVVSLGLTVRFP